MKLFAIAVFIGLLRELVWGINEERWKRQHEKLPAV
jgi:hypothetical protein